jgi:ATP-dependent DNA helicase DinG
MLGRIRRWSRTTTTGDLSEVKSLRDADPARLAVTSTRENCLGASCPAYSRCHVVAARRDAQAADIVVVNHHLLLADLTLKDEGFGELLPGAEAVILDEAHQVPEIAAQFFGREFSADRPRTLRAMRSRNSLGWASRSRRPATGLPRSNRRWSRPTPRSSARASVPTGPTCLMRSWARSTGFARP